MAQTSGTLFAGRVFTWGGAIGLLSLAPMYFMESTLGELSPPPLNHPEFFYGFIGVALAWQIAFLIIGSDPMRYRMLMLPSMVEKFSFSGAMFYLLATGRVAGPILVGATFDFVLGVLFVLSFLRTRQ